MVGRKTGRLSAQPITGAFAMYFTHAITRLPADTVAAGLTTASLGAPDAALTRQQFREYIDILLQLGLTVTTLPALPDFPMPISWKTWP
jgi:hypothetical protein